MMLADDDLKHDAVHVEKSQPGLADLDKTHAALAAEATTAEHELTLWQALKKYPKACLWSIAISTSIIMEGYDIVLITSLFGQPAFAGHYGKYDVAAESYQLSAAWQAGLTNGTSIGTIIGAFLNGQLTLTFGYRKVLMASLLSLIAFIFIPFFAPSVQVLLVGQILCGMPWGVFATAAPAYASEVCPTVLRGYLTVYVNLTWALGQLISAGVMSAFSTGTTKWAYKIPFAIQWAWPIPLAAMVFLAPESPWHLVRKGRLDAARRSVQRLTTSKDPEEHQRSIALMLHTNQLEQSIDSGTSYLDCFKGVDRRRTEIACMAFAAQPFCGSAIGGTPTYFFLQAGLPTSISFKMSVGGLGLAAVGTILSWKLMHSFGRRTLYLWGLAILTALLFTTGFVSIGAGDSVGGNYAQAVMMLLWLLVYYTTVGPICYAIIGETSSTRLRNKSVCLARIAYYLAQITTNAVNPFMLNPTAGDWKGKTALLWGGCAFAFFVWTFFRLPETKGRTYEELDILFAERVKTRDFTKMTVDAYAQDGDALVRKG